MARTKKAARKNTNKGEKKLAKVSKDIQKNKKGPKTLSERFNSVAKNATKPGMKKKGGKKAKKAPKPVDADTLDKKLDSYMMMDKEVAKSRLDNDLDTYMSNVE